MSWSSKHGIGKRNHLHNAHREHRDRYVAPPGQGHATCDPNTEVPKMLFPTQWGSTAASGGDLVRQDNWQGQDETVTGETILSRSNDPVPVETRLQIVLAVMSGEITIAEAARRHGVSTESINRWRNRFVDAGKAAMEDGMPGGKGAGRGNFVERRQRAEIQELKLALAEATVQLRIWAKGSEYIDQVPSQTSRP